MKGSSRTIRTLCSIYAALLVAGSASAWTGDPIPNSPDALTMAGLTEKRLEFYQVNVIETFKQRGYATERWYDDALAYLEHAIRWYANSPSVAPLSGEFAVLGRKVWKAGCNDPLFKYAIAKLALYADPDVESAIESSLQQAIQGFKGSDYPPNHLAFAAVELIRFYDRTGQSTKSKDLEPLIVDALARTVKERVYPTDQMRLLLVHISGCVEEGVSLNAARSLLEKLRRIPGIDPWLLQMTEGVYNIQAGWKIRSDAIAAKVTEEQWRRFIDHLQSARRHLIRAYQLHPEYPETSERMIMVTMGLGDSAPAGEDERVWFDRAVQAQMDWRPAYRSLLWSLRPRWGGSHEAMLSFGKECLNTKRYDTRVPFFYVQAILDIAEDFDGELAILRQKNVYETALATMDRLVEQDSYAHDDSLYRSIGAAFACEMQQYDRADALLREIDYQIKLGEPAKPLQNRARTIVDESRLYSSSVTEEVLRADGAMRSEDFATAAASYQRAMDATVDQPLKIILQDRLETASVARDFHLGKWVSLRFNQYHSGWRTKAGTWFRSKPSQENTVRGYPHRRNGFLLIHQAPIGPRFEMEGSFDFSEMYYEKRTNLGVIIGYIDHYFEPDWQAVLFYRGEKVAVARSRWNDGPTQAAPIEPKSEFRVLVWDDEVVAYVNGKLALVGKLPERTYAAKQDKFGIGGHYWFKNSTGSFADLRIRKLESRPEELATSVQENRGGS